MTTGRCVPPQQRTPRVCAESGAPLTAARPAPVTLSDSPPSDRQRRCPVQAHRQEHLGARGDLRARDAAHHLVEHRHPRRHPHPVRDDRLCRAPARARGGRAWWPSNESLHATGRLCGTVPHEEPFGTRCASAATRGPRVPCDPSTDETGTRPLLGATRLPIPRLRSRIPLPGFSYHDRLPSLTIAGTENPPQIAALPLRRTFLCMRHACYEGP